MMKKILVFLAFIFSFSLFAEVIPNELVGIWEGKDRLVFFEQNQNDNSAEIVIVLKEYYGWYLDRTSEPSSYNEIEKRSRNAATPKEPEHIKISFTELKKDKNLDAYEINLEYSKSEKNSIPVAIVDDKMYLNFYLQDSEDTNAYKGVAKSSGLFVTDQPLPENLGLLYVLNENLYHIRYWKSDMEYSDEKALYKLNDTEFYVPKHIISGGQNYSCVSGRSKKIRNPELPEKISETEFETNEKSNSAPIIIAEKEPYLKKIKDEKTVEDLMKIIKERNSRRKPLPPPLFPDEKN